VTLALWVAPVERDDADHRPVEVDHEEARAPPGHLRHRALELVTRTRTTDVGAHLGGGEQLDDRRTVPGLGLTEHEALGPDRGRWPSGGFQICHARRLAMVNHRERATPLAGQNQSGSPSRALPPNAIMPRCARGYRSGIRCGQDHGCQPPICAGLSSTPPFTAGRSAQTKSAASRFCTAFLRDRWAAVKRAVLTFERLQGTHSPP